MSLRIADLTKRLFRRSTKKTPKPPINRARLSVTELEDRVVPATAPPLNEIIISSLTPAGEGWTNGSVNLQRSGDLSQPLTVAFTLSGTATDGTDYTASAYQFDFATGSSTAGVTFTPVNDTDAELDETIILTVPTTVGGFTILSPTATVPLWDNDRAPLVKVTASGDTTEGGPAQTFTITRYSDLQGPASANFLFTSLTASFTLGGTATGGGTDYTASATTSVTF